MSKAGQGSIWAVYRRLFRYVRPYTWLLIVGIVASIGGGSSLFGLLSLSHHLFRPLDVPPPAEAVAAAPELALNAPDDLPPELHKYVNMAESFGLDVFDNVGGLTWQAIALSLTILPLLALARGFANFLNRFAMRWIGNRICRDLRDALFRHIQHQSLRFFGRNDVGGLISRCTNDTAVSEQVLSNVLADGTRAPVEVVVAAGFAVYFAVQQGIGTTVGIMLVVMPLCLLPVMLLGRYVRRHMSRALARVGDLVTRMHETFTGARVVKAYHMEAQEIARFEKLNAGYFRSLVRSLWAELLMTPLMETVAVLLGAAFFITCFTQGIRISQIMPIGLAAILVYRPLKQITRIQPYLARGAAALERLYEILDTDDRLAEKPGAQKVVEFREAMAFENVGFTYESTGPQFLADINLTLKRGSVVALVGATGSGKSTLANLLARFYDPTAGRITLDGIDLRDIEVASLRKLTTVVTQETILFNDTIAANIAYGIPEATRAQIEEAARQANAHDFIVNKPGGYDCIVGEKGFVLSGGERQRLAFARAILRNPPILILDEATSALDTVTEALVQEAIARVMEHRTVFAIAHRLSTVRHADQILVVDAGRIAERGTHRELYEAGGLYRKLCDMQLTGR